MTIKINNIEKSVDETKKDVKDIHTKLDSFITSANEKYVTKKQLAILIPLAGLAMIGLLVVNHLI